MKTRTLFPRLTALAAAGCMVLSLAACGGNGGTTSTVPSPSDAPTQTTTTTEAPPPTWLNPLTGEMDMLTENNRPIGIVVTDEDSKLVQLNLECADMYFESETEAGIPRILAIFSSVDRLPTEIGPVRSARPHFVKFAKSLDCIYCHIGGSQTGLNTIKELKMDHITNASVISPILKASKNLSWNRSVFTREKILKNVSSKKFATTTNKTSPYQFGTSTGTGAAPVVNMKISGNYRMAFTYDATSGLYQKHRNALSTAVHVTETGGTIEVANVILMYDNRTFDELYTYKSGKQSTRYDFDMNSGTGYLATGGTYREIYWVRTDERLAYFEADGVTPLTVTPGKTFVCLGSDSYKSQLKFTAE